MTREHSIRPVLAAHWDVDLYPRNARPITEELAIHTLQHGKVLIKDVDLLLNPTIRTALAEKGIRTQFKSLLETGRIRVLLPPKSTRFDIDPTEQPLAATAQERHNKRPYRFRIWKFTETYRRYCAIIDPILRETKAIKFRNEYETTNTFASTLHKTLNEETWRQRREFNGIDRFAERYAQYCQDPKIAIGDLHEKQLTPLAKDFYRTIAYQCVRLPRFGNSKSAQRNMRRLLQSVYAYCETQREQANSTYFGEQLTELPARKNEESTIDLLSLGVKAPNLRVKIPVAANIGEIIEAVIKENPSITDIWALADQEENDQPPLASLEETCTNIAESFTKHSMNARPVKWSPAANQRWRYVTTTHIILFLISFMGTHGIAFIKDHEEALQWTEGFAILSKKMMTWIRTGHAQDKLATEQSDVQNFLYHTLRSGHV